MLDFSVWFTHLVFVAAIYSQISRTASVQDSIEDTGRFGISIFDPLRKWYCRSVCGNPQSNSYLANLSCAIKCPELYLPQATATTATTTTIVSTAATTMSPDRSSASNGSPAGISTFISTSNSNLASGTTVSFGTLSTRPVTVSGMSSSGNPGNNLVRTSDTSSSVTVG